jgi:hypothetical protein
MDVKTHARILPDGYTGVDLFHSSLNDVYLVFAFIYFQSA